MIKKPINLLIYVVVAFNIMAILLSFIEVLQGKERGLDILISNLSFLFINLICWEVINE